MTADDFVRLAGGHLLHITPARNAAGITSRGLICAADLAGANPERILLRTSALEVVSPQGRATLTHQRPLRMGRGKPFLDGHTLRSWAAQLDRRIFFWPHRKGEAFARSLSQRISVLRFDAYRLFETCAAHLFLSPINSGNAARRPARRGDWIYTPATASVEAFRENRRKRGLTRSRDSLTEVSLTCPLPPNLLRQVLL